jgi:hypothetical protein
MQPPYSTPDAVNVRAKGPLAERRRGGSRPGLVKMFADQLGAGTPVNLLGQVSEIISGQATEWVETFGPFNYTWVLHASEFWDLFVNPEGLWPHIGVTPAGWAFPVLPGHLANVALVGFGDLDPTAGYTVSAEVAVGWLGSVRLYAKLDDQPPDARDSALVAAISTLSEPVAPDTTVRRQVSLSNIVSGVTAGSVEQTFDDDPLDPMGLTAMSLQVSGGSARLSWRGTERISLALGAQTGNRVGFGLHRPTWEDGEVQVHQFTLAYQSVQPVSGTISRLVAGATTAGDQTVHRVKVVGGLERTGLALAVGQRKVYSTAQRYGKIYVADGTKVREYNPTTHTATDLTLPSADEDTCTLIARYKDRLVLSGGTHIWYMCRRGYVTDWAYDDADEDAATVGTKSLGVMPSPVSALVVPSDDYLFFGCLESIYILRGVPRAGGSLDELSTEQSGVGILGSQAFCVLPNGMVFILSADGLYRIPPGGLSYAEAVSPVRLPRAMKNIDIGFQVPVLGYDVQRKALLMGATSWEAGGGAYYLYEIEADAFIPVAFPANCEPFTLLTYHGRRPQEAALLLGCRDGYIRRFEEAVGSDDGTEMPNHVVYGPIRLGRNGFETGIVTDLVARMAEGSGDVTWSLHVGDSAEKALAATAAAQGTWSAGPNRRSMPRVAGCYCCLKLTGSGYHPWAVEGISLNREPFGEYLPL